MKSIFFEITDICNHRCIHCCKSWRTDCNHTMNQTMLDKIISIPKDHLTISGGEPSLVKEQVRYIIQHEQVGITINTNLTNWSEQELRELSQHYKFSISVVSMFRKEYEAVTKADTYDKFIHNLRYVSKNSRIVMIINDDNYSTIEQSLNRLVVMGFNQFIISPAIPNGYAVSNKRNILDKIYDLYKTHRQVKIETMSPVDNRLPYNHECGAGKDRIVILSNGDAVPCACFTGYILGNIMTDSFDVIDNRADKFYYSYPEEKRILCKGELENV